MMSRAPQSRAGKMLCCLLLACLAAATVPASAAQAWPYGVDHSIFYLDSEPDSLNPVPRLSGGAGKGLDDVGEGPGDAGEGLDDADEGPGSQDRSRSKTIVGASLFGSGVFLCSWGIVSWQTDDTQCCPTNNTQNVIKIVTGVLLLNAGLVYLLELQ